MPFCGDFCVSGGLPWRWGLVAQAPCLPRCTLGSAGELRSPLEIGHLVGRASTPAAGLQTRPAQALACERRASLARAGCGQNCPPSEALHGRLVPAGFRRDAGRLKPALRVYCWGTVPAANREVQLRPVLRISLNATASPGLADCMMLRTSAAVATLRRLISTSTSPFCRPMSSANEPGSTLAIATPP